MQGVMACERRGVSTYHGTPSGRRKQETGVIGSLIYEMKAPAETSTARRPPCFLPYS